MSLVTIYFVCIQIAKDHWKIKVAKQGTPKYNRPIRKAIHWLMVSFGLCYQIWFGPK